MLTRVSRIVIKYVKGQDPNEVEEEIEAIRLDLRDIEPRCEVLDGAPVWRGHQFLGSLGMQYSPALIRRYAKHGLEITAEVVELDVNRPVFMTQETFTALRQANVLPAKALFIPYDYAGDQRFKMTSHTVLHEGEEEALTMGYVDLSLNPI